MENLASDGTPDGLQALTPASLAVRASARLTLPAHSAEEVPETSRATYMAASMLRQHIASLQPKASEALGDTSMTGGVQLWRAPTSPHSMLSNSDMSCNGGYIFG